MTRDEFRSALRDRGRDQGDFLHLPGADAAKSPEGCVVIERGADSWSVYRSDRGVKDRVELPDEESAYDYAFRRWVRWEDV